MIVVLCTIFTFVPTVGTSNQVASLERAFALGEISKQEHSRVALLTGDNDVPSANSGIYGHREILLSVGLAGCEEARAGKARMISTAFQAKSKRPAFSPCVYILCAASVRLRTHF